MSVDENSAGASLSKRVKKAPPELYVPEGYDWTFVPDRYSDCANVFFVRQEITTEYITGISSGPSVGKATAEPISSTRYAFMNADAEYTEQEVSDAVAGFTIRRIIGCDIISVLSDGQLAWADSLSNAEREAFLESKRNKLLSLTRWGLLVST